MDSNRLPRGKVGETQTSKRAVVVEANELVEGVFDGRGGVGGVEVEEVDARGGEGGAAGLDLGSELVGGEAALASGGGHVPAGPRVDFGRDGHSGGEVGVRGEDAAHDLLGVAAGVGARGVELGVTGVDESAHERRGDVVVALGGGVAPAHRHAPEDGVHGSGRHGSGGRDARGGSRRGRGRARGARATRRDGTRREG